MPPHDPHFHDCPNTGADGRPCKGKASIPARDPQGRSGFKCTRCGKVASEDQLRRASIKRMPPDDD